MSTRTRTGIANQALIALGELTVTDVDTDTSKRATTIAAIYDEKLLYLLRKYDWKFAIKRELLVKDGETPVYEFSYQYELPSDYVKLIEVYPIGTQYRLESKYILCNLQSGLYIKFIFNPADLDDYDSSFAEAFAALLAREVAIPLTDSVRKQAKMDEMFEDKIADARFSGSIEDDIDKLQPDVNEGWETARY